MRISRKNITVAQMILALEGSYSIEPESVNEDALCETVSKGDGHAVVGSRERGDEADLREHYAGGSGE